LDATSCISRRRTHFLFKEIAYNWTTDKAKITEILTQEGENFLNGQAVKKVDSNTMYMAGTGFTTCSHEEPHFQIKTNKSKIEMGERIITGPRTSNFSEFQPPWSFPYGYFPTNIEKAEHFGLLDAKLSKQSFPRGRAL
jgi:LPS-assembly protein